MADISASGLEFRTGSVIARSFSVFFRNIAPFGLLALVLTSPTYVYAILAGPSDLAEIGEFEAGVGTQLVVGIIEILLTYLVTAALVYGTIQDLKNRKVSVGDCFSQGLARMLPALGVAIVSGLVTLLAAIPIIFAAFIPLAIPILAIPAVIVLIMLWVAIPVAVVERRGINSLGRSTELTKGYRWRIFFVLLILIAILIAMSLLVGVAIAGMAIGGSGEMSTTITGAVVMEWILSALISAFLAVTYAVSYHDLRVAKEGVDTDQIAAVFD
jgi:hypothetical protein